MSLFGKIFSEKTHVNFIEEFLQDFFAAGNFSLHCDVEQLDKEGQSFHVDLYGRDEEILIENHGKMLQAFQVLLSSIMQKRVKANNQEDFISITVDSQDFLENEEKDLLDLAIKLKKEAIKKRRSVVIRRPLSSFQRRKIHQLLTEDGRVETQSFGEGKFKKIKIIPTQKKQAKKQTEDVRT